MDEKKEIGFKILYETFGVLGDLFFGRYNAFHEDVKKEIDRAIGEVFEFWGWIWEKCRDKFVEEDVFKLLSADWDKVKLCANSIRGNPNPKTIDKFFEDLRDMKKKLELV